MSGNLPTWPGASEVYSKAYRRLEEMARNGHVRQWVSRGKVTCIPSAEMDELIDALNKGNEEKIKGLLLQIP